MNAWTRTHQRLLQWIFAGSSAAGIVLDLVLVLVLRVTSISSRVWTATQAHPTLIAAGILATVFVCYLVRGNRFCLFFAALLGGHLFTHW